jgi:RES domain-containing protein
MKKTAWRITKKRHQNSALSGEGAKLYGGRWNPPGYSAVYAADSLSLAILEMIVHLEDDEDLDDYIAIPIEFDDTMITTLHTENLPQNWSCLPVSKQTQDIGEKWLEEGQSLILKVPSSVVPNDCNFIINPLHPDFRLLQIGSPRSLQIDPRVSKRIH